jgi:hypothetical protein
LPRHCPTGPLNGVVDDVIVDPEESKESCYA